MSELNKRISESDNLWVNLALVATGLFAVVNEGLSLEVAGVIAGGKWVQTFIKNARFDVRRALTDSNWWAYFAAAAVTLFPVIPVEAWQGLQDVVLNLFNGNFQGAIMAFFSLSAILIKVIRARSDLDEKQAQSTRASR